MKLEATEMLQECDEAAGENDGLYKAVARWQLARLGAPSSDGTVPHETREMLNIAAFEPKRGTLDKYMSQAERNSLKESARSLMNSGSPEQKTAAELAYLCANLTQLQAPGDQKEALDDYKTAAKSGIEEARKKYLKLIQNIENQYPIQNDPQGTIMYAELLAEFYSEEGDAASALKWKLNSLLAGKEYPENELTELLKQASGYTNEKFQLDGNTCGMLQDLYYKAGMYDLSREWAGYGAEKGNAQSQYQYAVFLTGSADTDPKEIFELLRSAAEGGCRPAFAKLADCYYEGSGTEKDLEAAEQWYVKAGQSAGDEVLWKLAGIQLDQNRLADAKRTLTSIAARDSETNMLLAEISSRLVQPDETEFFLAEAANGGYVPAMIQLAEFAKEHDKPYMCAHWYQKASDEGNIAEAALHYAECRQDGYGVDCDYTDALRYYLKAAKAGLKEAYFPIAQLLESGRCGSENTSRALSYYIKAGNSGNAEAMYKVGMMCMDGIYTEQNTSIGLKWLEHAAAAGNVPALETLGEYWSAGTQPEENYNKAVSYLVSAATKGSSRAMTLLGRIYSLPIGIQNLPLARQCYEDAADTGDMDAIRALADMYSNGIGGERDSRKAASLRAKILAEDGSALAENAAAKAGRLYDQAVAAGTEGINKIRETVNDFIDDDSTNNDGVSGWLKDIGKKLKG